MLPCVASCLWAFTWSPLCLRWTYSLSSTWLAPKLSPSSHYKNLESTDTQRWKTKSSLIQPPSDPLLTYCYLRFQPFFYLFREAGFFRMKQSSQVLSILSRSHVAFKVPSRDFNSGVWLPVIHVTSELFLFLFSVWAFALTHFLGRNQAFLFPRMVTVLGQ